MALITTGFDVRSTAAEVIQGVDLSGRRAVVTGGASGIGVATARVLASAGADVTLAVRDTVVGARVAAEISSSTGNRAVHVAPLDLADRASVAAFVAAWSGPLHLLVNNAGVMATPETYTPDGWELQFATNHVGHFALTTGLHAALAGGASSVGEARVVAVSSSAHFNSPVIFDDLHFRYREYDPGLAYGQSKTANVLFAVGATARWAGEGITVNALMPGAIRTNLQRHVDGGQSGPGPWKTIEQGASTSVLLAASPLLKGVGGRYFVNNAEAEVVAARTDDMTGVAPYALDPANADRLWQVTGELLG